MRNPFRELCRDIAHMRGALCRVEQQQEKLMSLTEQTAAVIDQINATTTTLGEQITAAVAQLQAGSQPDPAQQANLDKLTQIAETLKGDVAKLPAVPAPAPSGEPVAAG